MAKQNQIKLIYLLNNKTKFDQPDYSTSKKKQIDHSKIIFEESTAKEYDFILQKKMKISSPTAASGQYKRNRDFHQIVVDKEGGYTRGNGKK